MCANNTCQGTCSRTGEERPAGCPQNRITTLTITRPDDSTRPMLDARARTPDRISPTPGSSVEVMIGSTLNADLQKCA